MESDLVASSDILAFLPHRALPVMYAVALDLRIFANNVSSVSISIVLKLKLHFYLLFNFTSFFPKFWGRSGLGRRCLV